MEDDWGSVPAQKRPEIRRRIAVIRSFLAIDDPTPEDRARAMQELGLSRASFHNLVRVMQAGAGLSEIQGTGPAPGKAGGRTLDAIVAALIEQAIENVGALSSTADVHREVERLCTLAGVTPPSSVTVRKRHLEVAKWLSTSADATLLVDHCALLLPIGIGDRVLLPVVTAAFLQPEGLIVSYKIAPLQPVCLDVAEVLLRCLSSYGQERRLQTYRMAGPAWNVFADVFRSVDAPVPEIRRRKGPGHEFRQMTGTTLGGSNWPSRAPCGPTPNPGAVSAPTRLRRRARSSTMPSARTTPVVVSPRRKTRRRSASARRPSPSGKVSTGSAGCRGRWSTATSTSLTCRVKKDLSSGRKNYVPEEHRKRTGESDHSTVTDFAKLRG